MTGTGRGLAVTGPKFIYTSDGLHCYAYSGEFPTSTSSQTTINDTTKNAYIIFNVYFTGPTKYADPNTGRECNWQVSFNDIIIATAHTDTSEGDILRAPQLELLVPPLTTVKIEVDGNDGAADYKNCCILIGKVFSE